MDMPMNMNMSGSSTAMPMHGMHGMDMKHKMWTYFHVKTEDTILFDFWMVKNAGQMVYSCFIIFALAFVPEIIKLIRWKIEQYQHKHRKDLPYYMRLFMPTHLIQTALFGIQLAMSYALMLVFMTFNVWLGISVVAGMTLSYLIFGSRQQSGSSSHF